MRAVAAQHLPNMHPTIRSAVALLILLSAATDIGAKGNCATPGEPIQKLVPIGPEKVFSPVKYMVGILGRDSNALCTGVLIRRKVVAVSATCIQKRLGQQPFKASIGGLNIGEQDGEWIQVDGIAFHNNFNKDGYACYNAPDIALLSLSRKASSPPIPILPNRIWRRIRADAVVNLEIFGWFSSSQTESECLSRTLTRSMSWGECANTISRKNAAKAAGLRCAQAPQMAVWFWDVGAPLTHTVNGKRYLLGLWSYEEDRCARNKNTRPPSIVYTPLPPLKSWIESTSFNDG